VYVQLTVLRNGQLASLRINKFSSDSRLDDAALEAVRRARFPKAPKGFSKQQQIFNLLIYFSR
jgi:protein TonB